VTLLRECAQTVPMPKLAATPFLWRMTHEKSCRGLPKYTKLVSRFVRPKAA
jgi:hypothetical protein